jgi:hypothetical protein
MRTRYVVVAAFAVAALLAVVIGLNDNDVLRPDRRDTVAAHLASAPVDGRATAQLAVVSGAATVSVRAADLGGDLYRVSTPVTSDLVPAVLVSGDTVQVQLTDLGHPDGVAPGPSAVQVLVSEQVRWVVRLDGGAAETTVDLASGRLAGLDFGAGSARIEATLPRPQGTVTVRMSGGAGSFGLHLPGGVPARVRLGSGASSVTLDGVRRSGITGGTTWAGPGWERATDRYDIDNTAGVSTLTLDRA